MEDIVECALLSLTPNGNLIVHLKNKEKIIEIDGIEVIQPPSQLYIDIFTKRIINKREYLRCIVRSKLPNGKIRAKILYRGWQDKSGDVWLDLALALIDEGVVRVSEIEFPEREEYLQHERNVIKNSKR